MKRMYVFILLLLSIIVAIACCVKKPVFIKMGQVKIIALKDSILETKITFIVYNPNRIKAALRSSDIKTYYKNIAVGTSTLDTVVEVPARDTVKVPMITNINLGNLAKVFPELLAANGTSSFRIEGNNKVKVLGVVWNIPLKDEVKLNIRNLIINQVGQTFNGNSGFNLKAFALDKIPGLHKTGFKMNIALKNSMPFDYSIVHLNLDVYKHLGDPAIAHWELPSSLLQKAGETSEIPVQIDVNNLNVLRNLHITDLLHPNLDFLIKGVAEISLQGNLFTIPIEQTRTVAFNPISTLNF